MLSLLGGGVAHAGGASTKVEQGWELLNQQVANQAVAASVPVARGSLSGNFTPAPTAVFEVTGKVTGGTGGSWTVSLLNAAGTTLAATSFVHGTDVNFNLHTASLTNFSDAGSLSLTPSGVNPGVLSVNKAYVRFKQQGVVKATDAHVSMVGTQMGVTATTSSLVAAPTLYKHVASDFSPAPTVKLRATADAGPHVSLDVRLIECSGSGASVDCTSGSIVNGVTFSNNGATTSAPASLEASVTLVDGKTYAVWASVATIGTNGPQGDGPTGGPTGDLISADLELRQTTTNSRGLEKTVSWSQSVTSAVNAPPSGNANFLFEAPSVNAPTCETPLWLTTVASTSGSTTMSADMRDNDASSTLSSESPYTGTVHGIQQVSATAPTAGHVLDTIIASGSAGTITWSALRYALCLWDFVSPTITNFHVSQTPFNPNAGSTTFLGTLADDYEFSSWAIAINGHSDRLNVRNLSGTSANLSAAWDGKNNSATFVGGGLYDAILTVLDTSGNTATATISVTVAFPPVIANYLPSVTPFSPGVSTGTKDDTTFQSAISGDAPPFSWTLNVKNSGGSTVKSFTGSGTSVSVLWDGKNSSNAYVVSGNYTGSLSVTDAIGSVTVANTPVTVDQDAPVITSVPTTYLSGTGNGAHSRTISPVVTEVSTPVTFNAAITDASNNAIRTLSGATLSWDGKDTGGVLQSDGTYTISVTATDTQNLTSSSTNGSIIIDSVSPTITDLAVDNVVFSPNSDGVKDYARLTAEVSDTNRGAWGLGVYRGAAQLPTGSCSGCSFYPVNTYWDGGVWDYQNGNYVRVIQPDDTYVLKLTAIDLAGNFTAQSTGATIDTQAPTISVAPSFNSHAFSPNGDGVQDLTTLSAEAIDAHPGSWTAQFRDVVSPYAIRRVINGSTLSTAAVWDGKDANDDLVAQGSYAASVRFVDDAGNAVTGYATPNVVLDVSKPYVKRLLPEDGANSQYASQPIGLQFEDLSGLNSSSISLSLDGIPVTIGTAGNPGWLISTPQALVPGTTYSAHLSVSDEAGNQLHRDWSFLAIPPASGAPATATLDAAGENTHVAGSTPGTETWRFSPSIVIDQTPVHFTNGSLHPGLGAWATTIPLGAARVQVHGVDWPVAPYATTASRVAYRQLSYGSLDADAMDVYVAAQTVTLDPVTLDLPIGVSQAAMHYEVQASGGAVGVCADPSATTQSCSPDPLRFFISRSLMRHSTYVAAEAPVFGDLRLQTDPLNPLTTVWTEDFPLRNLPGCIYDLPTEPVCPLEGLWYSASSPVLPPTLWNGYCTKSRFCRLVGTDGGNHSNEASADPEAQAGAEERPPKYACVSKYDGTNIATTPTLIEWCKQQYYTEITNQDDTLRSKSGKRMLRVYARVNTDWGVNNNSWDNMGISLGTHGQGATWAVVPQNQMPTSVATLDNVVWTYDAGDCFDGLYPQRGICDPYPEQVEAYIGCFIQPGFMYLGWSERRLAHDTGDGKEDFGIGLDPPQGIRQREHISCAAGGTWLVTERAEVTAFFYETKNCGSGCGPRKDGNLHLNYGYTMPEPDWGAMGWDFALRTAINCAFKPQCWNPYGVLWTALRSMSESQREHVVPLERPNAFRYD